MKKVTNQIHSIKAINMHAVTVMLVKAHTVGCCCHNRTEDQSPPPEGGSPWPDCSPLQIEMSVVVPSYYLCYFAM